MTKPHKIDRTTWPKGQWDNEADRYEWRDKATGLPCLIVRNRSGALCGYVGVSPSHPWHGVDYAGCALETPCEEGRYCEHSVGGPVHGGLTYSGKCDGPICHTPKPGESDDVWWFGFDCAHGGDLVPALVTMGIPTGALYRNRDYVIEQCADLAQALALVGQTTEGESHA